MCSNHDRNLNIHQSQTFDKGGFNHNRNMNVHQSQTFDKGEFELKEPKFRNEKNYQSTEK